MLQLALFQSESRPSDDAGVWYTGTPRPCGAEAYVHLIRDRGDPQRLERDELRKRGSHDVAPHRTLNKTPIAVWRHTLSDYLARRGEPSTFNRMMLELTGVTADVAFSTRANTALWQLVEEEIVEHTAVAPILFRLAVSDENRMMERRTGINS